MRKKIWGVLGIVLLAGLAYLAIRSSQKPTTESETQTTAPMGGPEAQVKEEKPKAVQILYRQNLSEKQVVELRLIDLDGKNKKVVFTDFDEDFRIRLVDGLLSDSILIFGTPLNETSGSIWQIKTDGSGGKKQLIDKFNASSFSSNGSKIAFVVYDNAAGLFGVWTMDMDGRFKKKILESETALSDPLLFDNSLAFVKIDKEGNGLIYTANLDGTNPKELLKANGELISALSFSANKFVYVKIPKAGGGENLAEIYLYDLNENKEKRITEDSEPDGYPVLSKDGTKIAFYKKGKIWLSNSDGSDQKALVEGTQPIGFIE